MSSVPILTCFFLLFDFSLTFPFVLSFLSLFHPIPNLVSLILSTFLPSLSIPTVALLNKCISHVVELIHGSFSSVPYGPPTVKLYKVFKVLALKQISVYSTGWVFHTYKSVTWCRGMLILYCTYIGTPQELEKCLYIRSAFSLCVHSGDKWQSSHFLIPW